MVCVDNEPVALCRTTFHRTYMLTYSLQPGQLTRPTVRIISLESIKTNFALPCFVFAHIITII